jgi:hypothetical protein
MFSLFVSVCSGQEWFTSFDVAKRLARVQNKMLFVLWEESFDYSIPLVINSDSGEVAVIDLSRNTSLDSIIWQYFVPVKLSELEYKSFIKAADGRGYSYINKLNDDSIKIMDVNGNILNIGESSDSLSNLSLLIGKYALDTSYLRSELDNYFNEKNFLSASLLAIRYVDFAIFVDEKLQPEIIALANIYLDESEKFLSQMNDGKTEAYSQKIELVRIKELVILNKAKKAYRQIKRIDEEELDAINQSLFAFLNYTVFKLLKDEMNADLWKSKVSSLDLKKAELILKNHLDGNTN